MSQRDILIVDDEVDLLVLLERIITQRTPYTVTVTASPLRAAQELEEHNYALLIADLKMPSLDGLDLLDWIRQVGRSTEVVIITAFGSVETSIEAMEKGVYDYITKPFRKERILCTVQRAMQWQRLKGEQAALERRLFTPSYPEALAAFQTEYARRALAGHEGNAQAAAQVVGLPPETPIFDVELPPAPGPDTSPGRSGTT
jgi:DNA-binding NtrC family response regulator